MSTVDELVAAAEEFLAQADVEASKLGNQGRSAERFMQKANITGTLAVATAIQGQQAAAAANSAAVAEARKQMEALAADVARLKAGRHTLATAVIDLGALVVGSKDFTVPWGKNLGDASYQVDLILDDVLLGRARAAVKTTYATSMIVTVTTLLAVVNATQLQAVAWRGV